MCLLKNLHLWISFCVLSFVSGQDRNEQYFGRFISKLNSYHHQVTGDVYAVNQNTLLIKDFSYDGEGTDTFFWSGSSDRPGPRGFLVPDEFGRTNVLKRYLNQDVTLTLPEGKTIEELRWFAIYDLTFQDTFGDVYIPEGFQPPQPQWLVGLSRNGHGVKSGRIRIIDAKTIEVTEFSYDGEGGQVFFWVGLGPQPSGKGTKVPDEYGYVNPLRRYDNENVRVTLPGRLNVFQIKWLSVWNVEEKISYGWTIMREGLNIPPSLVQVIPIGEKLVYPNCEQLHKDLQIRWSTHGPTISMEIAAQIDENEYVAFGFSGSENSSRMIGGDAVVAYIDDYLSYTVDYNITAHAPCHTVLGRMRGVCPDEQLGGIGNFQFLKKSRENGITSFELRRDFNTRDPGDIIVSESSAVYIIWAIGSLDSQKKPTFHRLFPKYDVKINFNRRPAEINCQDFTSTAVTERKPWTQFKVADASMTTITARLGPSGGSRGYPGMTGQTSFGLSWYLHGYLAPVVYLERGMKYQFLVEGGNNPSDSEFYHPFIITDEPTGGYGQLDEESRREIRVLAGVEFTRRGVPQPTAAGRLCRWKHKTGGDRRLDDDFPDFKRYRNSLTLACVEGSAAVMEVTPNSTWPPIVWYHSYSRPHMGWQLRIVDRLPQLTSASAEVKLVISCMIASLIPVLGQRLS